ncbi:MAG TPA: ABC transporter permease [Terracidiphilus sp.]|nr:ABC transporter permease [Terracidiphilus sp.]
MSMIRGLASTLRTLFRRQQVETDLDDEIRGYVDAVADEKIARGISPAEARRQALAESGGLEQVKQSVRDRRSSTAIESVLQDIRYGLRQMRHNPAFTWTAVITLGLGIGATTAIFSAVYALLIRPLPYPDSARLMEILDGNPKKGWLGGPLISPDFVAAQSSLRSFESVAGFEDGGDMNLTGAGDPMRVKIVGITANFLPQLGVLPEKGRGFLRSEDRLGGPAVVLLSHRLWQGKFGGDASVINRSITLSGKAWTVAGVLPAHFIFPDPAMEPDLYIPAGFSADTTVTPTSPVAFVHTIGRLRDSATVQQANADLRLFAGSRSKSYPADLVVLNEGREIDAEPLHRYLTGDNRKPLLILLACVGAVLLIACANVANLQLARTVARRHEMALRGALGAGKIRLIRQSLIESLTLAAMAAVLGLGIAVVVTWLIRQGGIPGQFSSNSRIAELLQVPFGKLSAAVDVNGWVLAFTAGLVLLTTILFGLAPAIGASRSDLRTALQSTARHGASGHQQRQLRSVLLMTEIGLSVVLLTGAGLLIRSFVNVLRSDSGFDPRQCLTAQLQRNYTEPPEKTSAFLQQLLSRLRTLPGVQVAAIASNLPLQNITPNSAILPADGPVPPIGQWQAFCTISVSSEYFRAAGTRVLTGRTFNDQDRANSIPVVIVNQAFASQFFKGEALGKQIRTNIQSRSQGPDQFARRIVVGVVQDVRYNGAEGHVEPVIYLPIQQVPEWDMNILLRADVEPGSLSSTVRKTVIDIDPQQPLFDIQTMDGRIAELVAQRRLMMLLIASFALLALMLAAVGVYGVFSYWVSQRRQEMGIRLALGSSRPELLRLVLMQALRLISLGSMAGFAGAWFLDRLLASTLVGVKVHDPLSLSLACALMMLIALLGSAFPALSASRTDVVSVIHSE